MHKIDTAGSVDGAFVDGNPATSTPSTIVDAAFLQALQDEMVNVIEAAGITLNKADHTQLFQAISVITAGRLNNAFKPRPNSPANMRVVVASGYVFTDAALLEVAEQQTAVFTAPGSQSRIDRIVVDRATGVMSVVQGAVSLAPVPPAIPTGKNPIAQVVLIAGQTSIPAASIVDERALYSMGLGQASFANLGGSVKNVGGNLYSIGTVPIGTVLDYPCAVLPDPTTEGLFYRARGQAISRTTFATCFARMGTAHGYGDGVNTFNLPDRRGRVPRGWDDDAGRDPDRASRSAQTTGGATGNAIGSVQGDAMKKHRHLLVRSTSNSAAGLTALLAIAEAYNPGGSGFDQKYQLTGISGEPNIGRSSEEGESTETRMKNQNTDFIVRVA